MPSWRGDTSPSTKGTGPPLPACMARSVSSTHKGRYLNNALVLDSRKALRYVLRTYLLSLRGSDAMS